MSLSAPTEYGPANPPRFPTELIRAMPPAAAVPLRKDVGSAQNGPSIHQIPNAVRDAAISVHTHEWKNTDMTVKPMAAAKAGMAACHRRSLVWSEWWPQITMLTAATE